MGCFCRVKKTPVLIIPLCYWIVLTVFAHQRSREYDAIKGFAWLALQPQKRRQSKGGGIKIHDENDHLYTAAGNVPCVGFHFQMLFFRVPEKKVVLEVTQIMTL